MSKKLLNDKMFTCAKTIYLTPLLHDSVATWS